MSAKAIAWLVGIASGLVMYSIAAAADSLAWVRLVVALVVGVAIAISLYRWLRQRHP